VTAFVVIAVLFVAVALGFVLPPLLRRQAQQPAASRDATNAGIYREQLEELRADLERGAIDRAQYDRARLDIERRIVDEHERSAVSFESGRRVKTALAIGIAIPLVAGLAYWKFGAPQALTGEAVVDARNVTPEQILGMVKKLAARMEKTPDDVEGWVMLGRSYSVLGMHAEAARAFERAVKLVPGDPNLLADYADNLAMASGRSLAGKPMEVIQQALKIDPKHVKALALAGSAEFERRDYRAAVGYWERILTVVPPESDFARQVNASIEEARQLGGIKTARAKPAPSAKASAAQRPAAGALSGVVSIEPSLAKGFSPDTTVFVVARPAEGSRMPLAVARTTLGALPYRFKLDDSMAMNPAAKLSEHKQVVIVARVSRSGTALPQKGDVEGISGSVAPDATGVRVVMSKVVD
jgi:cytochrome c-type biogenesis protein CcmH